MNGDTYGQDDLAVLTPLWRRPHRVVDAYDAVRDVTPCAHLVLVVSPDDQAVADAAVQLLRERMLDEPGSRGRNTLLYTDWPGGTPGDYARKMNLGYRATTEPLLFLGADDVRYHDGWYDRAIARLGPGVGVVGTNDLGNPRVLAGRHSTHSLVVRSYVEEHGTIDEPGLMLHEGYVHEYVDDELVHTAKFRSAYAHAGDAIVEHLHPHWGKAETDASYDEQSRRMAASIGHYRERQVHWGGRA